MIINSSAVGMAAKTTKKTKYTETNQTLMTNALTGERQISENKYEVAYERTKQGKMYSFNSGEPLGDSEDIEPLTSDNYNDLGNLQNRLKNGANQNVYSVGATEKERSSMQELIDQLRNFLLRFRNELSLMIGRRSQRIEDTNFYTLDLSSGSGNVNVWRRTEYKSYTYEEKENLTFETTGQVVTADGKIIEFNMQLEMSREFQESSESITMDTVAIMTDPLVISLNSNPVSVSDQKWMFDIDGDGSEDSISMLSKGSGYLAFDKNQDGIINDGKELFGAATGNGFQELAEYDEDGNGWIDENDSIYGKLSVWLKDDAGNDRMVSLKDANVGAIYLASMATNFSLKSEEDNSHNADIRRTGMYLSESGVARTIQQLDMVSGLLR